MENQLHKRKFKVRARAGLLSGWLLGLFLVLGMISSQALAQGGPAPADPSKAAATPAATPGKGDAVKGKAFFMSNCARCHSPALEKEGTGPALMGVTGPNRAPSREWIYEWIPNAPGKIAAGDKYALKLLAKYKVPMDPLPNVTRGNIDDILAFIEGYQVPGGGDGTKETQGIPNPYFSKGSSTWAWVSCIILAVIILLIIIASQVSRMRGADSEKGMDLNKANGKFFLWFLVIGMILAVWSAMKYSKYFLLSNPASEHGKYIDNLFWVTMIVVVLVFITTNGVLFYFAYKYRGTPEGKADYYPENHKLEMIWTIVPAIVLTALVIGGIVVWNWVQSAPKTIAEDPGQILVEVSGQQFGWLIRYPGPDGKLGRINLHQIDTPIEGSKMGRTNSLGVDPLDPDGADDFMSSDLIFPKGRTVVLKIRSRDVIHSVYLPHFRVKMDAVPGMDTRFHFVPTITSDSMKVIKGDTAFKYELACTEVCGFGHFTMKKEVYVKESIDFDTWYKMQTVAGSIFKDPPVATPTAEKTSAEDSLKKPAVIGSLK